MAPQEDPRKQEEEYSFIQETFKDEKIGLRRRIVWKIAGLGLVFGLAASLGFFALKPIAERVFYGDPGTVVIPDEEESAGQDSSSDGQDSLLTMENYREMNKALRNVGSEASKCVVEITGISKSASWQGNEEDNGNSASGVIVADNGPELLIFASSAVLQEADQVQISFADGRTYAAEVKQRDENLEFAVYSVKKSEVNDKTLSRISVAVLGTSGTISQGDTVIALGSPFGYAKAMGFGVVASSELYVDNPDGTYRLICTDISGTKSGSGILVNVRGEVIGIIDQRVADEDRMGLVMGYGISDLKETIEILSNGKSVPYFGIIGVTVTKDISEEQGIPVGVYVQEVRMDSPAMKAGIQSGDVITGIGGEEFSTFSRYHSLLLEQEVGRTVEVQGMRQGTDGYIEVEYTVTVGSKSG